MKHQMNWIKRSANILVCLSTGEVSWANLTHPIQHSIRFNSINSQLEDASKLLQEIRLKTAFEHFRVESISSTLQIPNTFDSTSWFELSLVHTNSRSLWRESLDENTSNGSNDFTRVVWKVGHSFSSDIPTLSHPIGSLAKQRSGRIEITKRCLNWLLAVNRPITDH